MPGVVITEPIYVVDGYYDENGNFVQTGIKVIYGNQGGGGVGGNTIVPPPQPPQNPTVLPPFVIPNQRLLAPRITTAGGWQANNPETAYDAGWKCVPPVIDILAPSNWASYQSQVSWSGSYWTISSSLGYDMFMFGTVSTNAKLQACTKFVLSAGCTTTIDVLFIDQYGNQKGRVNTGVSTLAEAEITVPTLSGAYPFAGVGIQPHFSGHILTLSQFELI